MSEHNTEEVKEEIKYQTISEFLESTPPNQIIHISDLSRWNYLKKNLIQTPEIQLHCNHEKCNGVRFFRCVSGYSESLSDTSFDFFYVSV